MAESAKVDSLVHAEDGRVASSVILGNDAMSMIGR